MPIFKRSDAPQGGAKGSVDPITGLASEVEGMAILERELAAATHSGRPVSVVMMELEHLNDALVERETEYREIVFEQIGAVLRDEMRSGDAAARGETPDEFLIVLPGAEREVAAHVALRLEQAIRRVLAGMMLEAPVTVCVGTSIVIEDGQTPDALVGAAREMMEYSRRLGGGVYAASRDTSLVEEADDDDRAATSYIATSVSIRALLAALETHAPQVAAHGRRVASYALAIASGIGFPEDDQPILKAAALLHDVGMLGVPQGILEKAGKLTVPEYQVIRRHPDIGYQLLRGTPWLQTAATFVRYHHEGFSGHGYPEGLHGQEIPLGSRIIAVAEAFDTMTTDQPYRGALTRPAALKAMRETTTPQFDPDILDAMSRLVEGKFRPKVVDVDVDFPDLAKATPDGAGSREAREMAGVDEMIG